MSDLDNLGKEIKLYSQAIALGGLGCESAKELRNRHLHNEDFCAFADALDQLHRNLTEHSIKY